MAVKVIRPGLLSTLQDTGRYGYGHLGISRGGAMDEFAYLVGNFLVGNTKPLASLEFFQPAPELYFESAAVVAITGPGCQVFLNDQIIPSWHAVAVDAGSTLKIIQADESSCGYISIHGGWKASQWLGSESTHLHLGVSGYYGRSLKKADTLNFNVELKSTAPRIFNWTIPPKKIDQVYGLEKHICCLMGPEYGQLGTVSAEQFVSQEFHVSSRSNRMGFRLEGNSILPVQMNTMVSSPVTKGTVQLLPDGQLIILMADHQTIGGYPRIGCVTETDLPRLAQRTARTPVFFSWCTPQVADELLQERLQWLQEIATTCRLNFNSVIQ
jgi:antagonist of KipI